MSELAAMEPLTNDERGMVDMAMGQFQRTLGQARFRPFVAALGRDRCFDAAVSAYMRAIKVWRPAESPFLPYAKFWLRKFLIHALAEAAATGAVPLPDSIAADEPLPEQTAERIELIAAAFKVIPQRQREIILLRAGGLTWNEVALALGCSRRLVHRHHARAMNRIWKLVPQVRGSLNG